MKIMFNTLNHYENVNLNVIYTEILPQSEWLFLVRLTTTNAGNDTKGRMDFLYRAGIKISESNRRY